MIVAMQQRLRPPFDPSPAAPFKLLLFFF